MEGMKTLLGQLAREETLRAVDRRFSDMANNMAGTLATSRNGIDPTIKALAARIEEIGGAVRTLPTSGTLRSLEDKMRVLQSAVERFSHEPQRPDSAVLDAIEERLDEISRAIAASHAPRAAAFDPEPFERIEARISALARQMDEAGQDGAVRDLGGQLATLSHRVEDLAHRVDMPERAIERLAGQIGAIADRLASMASLLEQRHDDALAQGRALFHDLEARIDDVAARIESERPMAAAGDDHFIAALDARFAELAARFERQAAAAAPRADDGAIRELEKRLDTISHRIEASVGASAVDPHLIRSLESQIAGLAEHISRPVPVHEAQPDLTPRLDKIEQSIVASRADVVEAARRAAEDAVRNFSGGAAESALVAGLADDLKALEALTRRSDDRNAKTFEAIHDTLLKIVDRLGAVEAGKSPLVREALGAARTPPLMPEAEAMPLAQALETTVAMPAGEAVAARSGSLLGGLARKLSSRKESPAAQKAAKKEAAATEVPSVDPDATARPAARQPAAGAGLRRAGPELDHAPRPRRARPAGAWAGRRGIARRLHRRRPPRRPGGRRRGRDAEARPGRKGPRRQDQGQQGRGWQGFRGRHAADAPAQAAPDGHRRRADRAGRASGQPHVPDQWQWRRRPRARAGFRRRAARTGKRAGSAGAAGARCRRGDPAGNGGRRARGAAANGRRPRRRLARSGDHDGGRAAA